MKYLVELCLPGDTVTPLLDMTLTLKADEEPEQDISEDISKFLIARLGFCNIYFVVLHDFFNFVNIILIMIIYLTKFYIIKRYIAITIKPIDLTPEHQ
jgi:hypothetical protein